MRLRLVLLTSFVVILALCVGHLGSEPTLSIPLKRSDLRASIDLGLEDPIGLLTSRQFGDVTAYSDGNYKIQIRETTANGRTIIRVTVQKESGQPFRMRNFSITARVPRRFIEGIWYPGADASSTNVMASDADHPINDISDANYGIPYLAAASVNSRNVFAMGLARQDLSVSISGDPVDTLYEFKLKALTSRMAETFDESFYLSNEPTKSWSDAAADFADWVDASNNYRPFPVSDRAYEPLYDAWYWAGDRVDDRLYRDTAKLASELGMGLYLADSGWDTDDGEWSKWLSGKTGDYTPPPTKFADLAETFNEIRGFGHIGIDLWLQPFAVGRESARYAATRDLHIQLPDRRTASMGWAGQTDAPFTLPLGSNLENVNLCPRIADTQTYLKNLFSEVATTYKPEGYWLDFIDGMPSYCIAPHAHTYATYGEGLKRSLQTIKETILAHDPKAIVHFRARYANLNTKPYANIWQSGDSPNDFDRMRLTSIRMRPFSKGVVFSADEMYWPEETPEPQVAKFIMTSIMVGVPAFGPTLLYSPPQTLEMLQAWLGFYRRNQREIATGKFTTFGLLSVPNHKIESAESTFVYVRNFAFSEVNAQTSSIYLMNATSFDRFRGRVRPPRGATTYSVRLFNRFLSPDPNEMQVTVDSRGLLELNLAVEQGGMILLTAQK